MHGGELFYKEALPIVKKGRLCIWPNARFAEQLDRWAYLDYDIHNREECGLVIDTKEHYYKTRARWEIFEKRRAAEKAGGYSLWSQEMIRSSRTSCFIHPGDL